MTVLTTGKLPIISNSVLSLIDMVVPSVKNSNRVCTIVNVHEIEGMATGAKCLNCKKTRHDKYDIAFMGVSGECLTCDHVRAEEIYR